MPRDLVSRILDFWFLPPNHTRYGKERDLWFKSTLAIDADIADRFGAIIDQALGGRYDHFAHSPRGALALCLLLDQMTRNAYRGGARAFCGDTRIRRLARAAVMRGFDRRLPAFQRLFLFLPFEHNESRGDQGRFIGLMARQRPASNLKYAAAHREIIARFGRFPHRNAALGRANTAAEDAYLQAVHPRFGQ